MKSKIAIMTLSLLGALFLSATPVQAHVEYTEVETITGSVLGTHFLQAAGLIIPNVPDEVTFTQKTTTVRDCGDGTVKSSATTIEYAGSQIEGEDGIYAYLAQFFIGGAGASAAGMGATTVWFGVWGQNALGWEHSFGGSGPGTHTINYYNNQYCAPPADIIIGPGILDDLLEDAGGDDKVIVNRLRLSRV